VLKIEAGLPATLEDAEKTISAALKANADVAVQFQWS
jgi:hypothetical protein